jgi:predicted SAM-dependent methyltransferase
LNNYLPPLDFNSNRFDFIFSISVFTHITEEAQIRWLKELCRIVKEGGYIMISIIEDKGANLRLKKRFEPGINRQWLGKAGAPESYFTITHDYNYIRDEWTKYVDVIMHLPKMIRGRLSLLLLKRKAYAESTCR